MAAALCPRIAIIGSGPSAIYALKYLGEQLDGGSIVMFEADSRAGVGTPYAERYNPRSMLANIASIELPPVQSPLLDWIASLPDAECQRLGIVPEDMDERHFFPRMVLGEYFAAQLEATIASAGERGIAVALRTRTPVCDLASGPAGVTVRSNRQGEQFNETFDFVIVATGHRAPRAAADDAAMSHPYRDQDSIAKSRSLGIIGTSLSAIDVAVAQASRHGTFTRKGGIVRYCPMRGEEDRKITMLSRSGILPEADFYCPIPYQPLDLFTEAAVADAVAVQAGALDRLFALFTRQLAAADPAYAQAIGLADCTVDDFARAYFAGRAKGDPFDWAKTNLAEVKRNAAARRTVAWRYAILRMHEPFGAVLGDLGEEDQARFAKGLKRVFIDNYAAVPPLSIERIVAMHDAGMLSIVRLGHDYATDQVADDCWEISNGTGAWRFDALVDARGQSALGQDEFPFPTLRLQIRAQSLRAGDTDNAMPLAEGNALADEGDPLARVYCLALPFLMWRNPFVQGLTAAHDLARDAVIAIAGATNTIRAPTDSHEAIVAGLEQLGETTLILQGTIDGLHPLLVVDPDSGDD
ncbi:MAG: FAD/NAD(P)-binding protein [Novosphingobium sp.]